MSSFCWRTRRIVVARAAALSARVRGERFLDVGCGLGGLVEAMGQAILAIGANPGELDCVLDQYLDHATDGTTCDAMSTMITVEAVSGFITGLDEPAGGE